MTPDDAAQVLGVDVGASAPDVERAYRVRARSMHPDAGGADDAFIRLTQARGILLAPPQPVVVRGPRRPSRLLFGTWIGLLVIAIALGASASPLPLAELLVRYGLLAVGMLGYALTGRRGYLVLGLVALAATAVVALVFTTLGALVGLLLMVAPVYGLILIGQRRLPRP